MGTFSRNGSLFYVTEGGRDVQPILRLVYFWMGLRTLLTTIVAYVTKNTFLVYLAANPVALLVAAVAEFGTVLGLNVSFNRHSSGAATALFFAKGR